VLPESATSLLAVLTHARVRSHNCHSQKAILAFGPVDRNSEKKSFHRRRACLDRFRCAFLSQRLVRRTTYGSHYDEHDSPTFFLGKFFSTLFEGQSNPCAPQLTTVARLDLEIPVFAEHNQGSGPNLSLERLYEIQSISLLITFQSPFCFFKRYMCPVPHSHPQ
jgi:hypothetical protein